MTQDTLGLDYSTSSEIAVQRFNRALDFYLGSRVDTMPAIDDILSEDPEMPMAIIFRGYLLKQSADPRFRKPLEHCLKTVTAREDLNDRESRHAKALAYLASGQLKSAAHTLDEVVLAYPRDMLALRIAHYLHFYCGGGTEMSASLKVALQYWEPGDPYYGYLRGMQSFALEESGDFGEAKAIGHEALEYNRKDIWAAHAVTHVYQMTSAFDQGLGFIESFESEWNDINNFVHHMYWHKALHFINATKYDAALDIYDERLVTPLADDFYLDVCNSASLLWRLEILGVDVGNRWEALEALSKPRVEDDELVFTTLHYIMAPARLGDLDAVDRGLAHFEAWSLEDSTQGKIARQVGLEMARGIALLGNKQFEEGATLLNSARQNIHLIGGSHAQRHLFDHLISHYRNE
ncbi:MAG: tetratricopeptide (TPR) repeat protein [Candidatus Azotimanducaceae bacterium]|jgi:tetratricopeptide (TPR) repeat protein